MIFGGMFAFNLGVSIAAMPFLPSFTWGQSFALSAGNTLTAIGIYMIVKAAR